MALSYQKVTAFTAQYCFKDELMAKQAQAERRVFKNDNNCPIRNVVAQIGDRWSILVLFALVDEADRFNSIKRRVEGISQKMLTETLRD